MDPALQGPLRYCRRTGASAPTVLRNEEVRRGGALPLPRAGKSAKRRRWRMQRAGFEEVPRLADTTVAGNRLARRWATAGPYGSVTRGTVGRRPRGSPLRWGIVGAVGRAADARAHGKAGRTGRFVLLCILRFFIFCVFQRQLSLWKNMATVPGPTWAPVTGS